MQAQILAPAAVLVVWTLIVLFWIIPARLRRDWQAGGQIRVGSKSKARAGSDLEGVIPDKGQLAQRTTTPTCTNSRHCSTPRC